MKNNHVRHRPKATLAGLICLLIAVFIAYLIWRVAPQETFKQSVSRLDSSEKEPLQAARKNNDSSSSEEIYAPETKPKMVTKEVNVRELFAEDLHTKSRTFSIAIRNDDSKPDPLVALDINLKPRAPHAPLPLVVPPGNHIRMTVKFMDYAMARSTGDNQIHVSDASWDELNQFVEIAHKHGLEFYPTFDNPKQLDDLRIKAAHRSGQMQADLNGTMTIDLRDPTQIMEIAQSMQAIDLIEFINLESLDLPPPPPGDIEPTTPSLEHLQGYLGTNPGFGVNHLKALGVNGEGVRFANCEYGYNPTHEDLVDSSLTDESRAAINPAVYANNWDNHGTAALGIIMAGDNGYGVTGIAPECDAYFYSEWTTTDYSRTGAISDALTDASEGDVILLEMQISGNESGNYVPAEYSSVIWSLTKIATDAGIIVVAAAGNGNQNLDDPYYASYMNRGDSGAIIVGAGMPNTTHSKQFYSTYGTRVDVQAWGSSVMTTGYGDYARYGDDDNQSYTSVFSGTSSASACVAGAVVLLQSYAKNALGTLFTPEEMRSHLKANGHLQGNLGSNIGRAIALDMAVAELPDRPMQITISKTNDDDIFLSLWGLPFRTHQIESSQNLIKWDDLITGIPGSASKVDEFLENEPKTYPQRFYRVSEE